MELRENIKASVMRDTYRTWVMVKNQRGNQQYSCVEDPGEEV